MEDFLDEYGEVIIIVLLAGSVISLLGMMYGMYIGG